MSHSRREARLLRDSCGATQSLACLQQADPSGGSKAPSRGGGALRRREIGREIERQLKVDIVEARAERE